MSRLLLSLLLLLLLLSSLVNRRHCVPSGAGVANGLEEPHLLSDDQSKLRGLSFVKIVTAIFHDIIGQNHEHATKSPIGQSC
jgi:hypothetical protein